MEKLQEIDKHRLEISPSLLAANPLYLHTEMESVLKAGADRIHIDIMDGHFVPNMTFGPHIISALKKYASVPFDIHLMVKGCDDFITMYAAPADTIIIHPESTCHLYQSLMRIKMMGKKAGIALNPGTPLEFLTPVWDLLDHILIMSVNPGFGGQNFISSSLEKIRHIRHLIDRSERDIVLAVDGGMDEKSAPKVVEAGATLLVAGTNIFKSKDYAGAIQTLRNQQRAFVQEQC